MTVPDALFLAPFLLPPVPLPRIGTYTSRLRSRENLMIFETSILPLFPVDAISVSSKRRE